MTAVAIIRSNPAFLKSSVTLTEDAVIILFPTALHYLFTPLSVASHWLFDIIDRDCIFTHSVKQLRSGVNKT